jgi:hypothetical protein
MMALRFGSMFAEEGGSRRRTARRPLTTGGGGFAERRREAIPSVGQSGHADRAAAGPEWAESGREQSYGSGKNC